MDETPTSRVSTIKRVSCRQSTFQTDAKTNIHNKAEVQTRCLLALLLYESITSFIWLDFPLRKQSEQQWENQLSSKRRKNEVILESFETYSLTPILFSISPLRDFISGAIMAATSVPQLIAYAETAGYAGYKGLATAGPPLLVWGLGKFSRKAL